LYEIAARMSRRAETSWPALLAACVVGLSCNDSTSPPPECANALVQVSASTGATPTFSWSPACRLYFLKVEYLGAGTAEWAVMSDSVNVIGSPVQFGVVPMGARLLVGTLTSLQPGTPYVVSVFTWTGPGPQQGVLIGSTGFTP